MNYRQSIKVLVLFVLVCYFVSKIIAAKEKLEAGKVALLIKKITPPTIQASCICYLGLR